MDLLFLDTETTGAEIGKDRVTQVAYKVGDELKEELFKPPIPISIIAQSVTHITDKMVSDKPPFQGSEMHKELENMLPEHILVAHNALFDIGMLETEGLTVPRFICTLRVARHLDPEEKMERHNLQYMRYYYGFEFPDAVAHSASGDVIVLEAVFEKLFEQIKEQHGGDEEAALAEMLEISTRPSIIRRFHFGKYRGKRLEDIASSDPGYLDWLLKQKESDGDAYGNDEELIHSLKHFLGRTQG